MSRLLKRETTYWQKNLGALSLEEEHPGSMSPVYLLR